jgi:hypothetical protein
MFMLYLTVDPKVAAVAATTPTQVATTTDLRFSSPARQKLESLFSTNERKKKHENPVAQPMQPQRARTPTRTHLNIESTYSVQRHHTAHTQNTREKQPKPKNQPKPNPTVCVQYHSHHTHKESKINSNTNSNNYKQKPTKL